MTIEFRTGYVRESVTSSSQLDDEYNNHKNWDV